jgi:hypothetical protein
MIAICLPTSLKSACWAIAEKETASNVAADAAFRNQDFVMNFKRDGVRKMSRKAATAFPDVDFQNP